MCWAPLGNANRSWWELGILCLALSGGLRAESVEVFQMLFQKQRDLAERSLQEEVQAVAVKYDQSVAKLEKPVQELGDLDLLLALQNARKSFQTGLPTEQGAPLNAYPPFQRLQDTWLRFYSQWQIRRAVRLTELVDQYDRMLQSQEVRATQSGEIDFALAVRTERERIKADEELNGLRAMAAEVEEEGTPTAPPERQVPLLAALQSQTVLYLSFDRDERERVTDRSPARNHGKIDHAEWVRGGRRGGGMRFADDKAQLVIGNAESLQITGDLTISFWMYPEELGARRNPLNKSFGAEYTLTLEEDGRINFYHGLAGLNDQPYQGFTSAGKVKVNTWVHVCMVRSREEQRLTWYFDGKKAGEGDSKYGDVTPSASDVILGRGYAGAFRGILDDVLILKTDLREAQVRRLYQSLGGR